MRVSVDWDEHYAPIIKTGRDAVLDSQAIELPTAVVRRYEAAYAEFSAAWDEIEDAIRESS